MPTIHKCENHKSCKGWAEPGEKRCQYCREAEKAEKVNEKYELDTTKFSSTRNWLNSWVKK